MPEGSNVTGLNYGTLEGRLVSILDENGVLAIRIKNFLYPRAIRCIVPEAMIDKVLNGFRRRVEIEGLILYSKLGIPISMAAKVIVVMPEDDVLPSENANV